MQSFMSEGCGWVKRESCDIRLPSKILSFVKELLVFLRLWGIMISNLNLANHDLNYLEAKGCLLEEKQSLLF